MVSSWLKELIIAQQMKELIPATEFTTGQPAEALLKFELAQL